MFPFLKSNEKKLEEELIKAAPDAEVTEADIEQYEKRIVELNNRITDLTLELKEYKEKHKEEVRSLYATVNELRRIANSFEYICHDFLNYNKHIHLPPSDTKVHCYKNIYGELPRDNRDIVIGSIRWMLIPPKDYTGTPYNQTVDWVKLHGKGK